MTTEMPPATYKQAGSWVLPQVMGTYKHAHARTCAHTHTQTHTHGPGSLQRTPRQTDLNELSGRLPSFLKVLLAVLLLHLERQPGPQDALEGGVRLRVSLTQALPAPTPSPGRRDHTAGRGEGTETASSSSSTVLGLRGASEPGKPDAATSVALCSAASVTLPLPDPATFEA